MMFRRYRNTHLAYCMATEPDGTVLVRDIWFFNPNYIASIYEAWEQVKRWNGQFSNDANYRWGICLRPQNM